MEQECVTRHGSRGPRPGVATISFAVKEGRATNRQVTATTSTAGADSCLAGAMGAIRFPMASEPTEVACTLSYNPR